MRAVLARVRRRVWPLRHACSARGLWRNDLTARAGAHSGKVSAYSAGYYREVLRGTAGISSCQVNSLEHVIGETQYPDLLMQDLSTVQFVGPDIECVTRESGRDAITLGQWLEIIDWYFAEYGATATAVKNQLAYIDL